MRCTHRGVYGDTIRGAIVERQLLVRVFCVFSFFDSQLLKRFVSCSGIVAYREVAMCRETDGVTICSTAAAVCRAAPKQSSIRLCLAAIGRNVPLCAVECVAKKAGRCLRHCYTVTTNTEMRPTTLGPLRQDLIIRYVARGVLSKVIGDFILQPLHNKK